MGSYGSCRENPAAGRALCIPFHMEPAMKSLAYTVCLVAVLLFWFSETSYGGWVESEDGRTFIVDRDGKRWDVTQAKEFGFIAQRFQYGIGKDAFKTLGDKDFVEDKPTRLTRDRIIGISAGDTAQAYSVNKLKYHEIANTTLDGKPIAVGY